MYPGCVRRVLPKQALLALYTAMPVFGLGLYLRVVHDINWAAWCFGLSGVLIFGVASKLLQKKLYGALPCPGCGRTNLTQSNSRDSDQWDLLICECCSIEWETGFGDGRSD